MKLDVIRKKIDVIDGQILRNLAERMRLGKEAKKLKVKLGLKIEDKNREKAILNKILLMSKGLGLSEKFVGHIFRQIIDQSKKIQKDG